MTSRSPSLSARLRYANTLRLRDKAQRKLQHAVARGTVKKPTRCQRCRKKFPKRKIHGHHRNYQTPLKVEWYCQACHYKKHPLWFQQRANERMMVRLGGGISYYP